MEEPHRYHYLSGPCSLYEVHDTIDKRIIYLMGDVHHKEHPCPDSSQTQTSKNRAAILPQTDILTLLKETFKLNEHKLIDFFFETELVEKGVIVDPYEGTGFTYDIHKAFIQCWQLNKANCPYRNVRFHQLDVRANKLRFEFAQLLYKLNDSPFIEDPLKPTLDDYYLNCLLNETNKRALVEWLQYSKTSNDHYHKKINKQFANVKDLNLRALLERVAMVPITSNKFNDEEIKLIFDLLGKWKGHNYDFKALTPNEVSQVRELTIKYIDYTMGLFDAYTMGRMFRDFNTTDQIKKQCKNIIVYVGNAHLSRLRMLFMAAPSRFKVVFQKHLADENQCTDISTLTQPLFASAPSNFYGNINQPEQRHNLSMRTFEAEAKRIRSLWNKQKQMDEPFKLGSADYGSLVLALLPYIICIGLIVLVILLIFYLAKQIASNYDWSSSNVLSIH